MPFHRIAYRLAVALAMLALAAPARAQLTFIVNSTVDAVDATPGNGICATAAATCTLRAAIMEADLQPTKNTLILVPAGNYRLTLANGANPCTATAKTGDLDVRPGSGHTIIVAGTSPSTTIVDGTGIDGVFNLDVPATGAVQLANMTIRGGNRLSTCKHFGGGVVAFSSPGSSGSVSIVNCVVDGNVAQAGGGIFNEGTTMSVTKSLVQNNRSSNNFAQVSQGGGIENFSGSLTVDQTTVSANRADVPAAAPATSGAGAGIGVFDGPVTVTNSTITGNRAAGNGGGIDVFGVVGASLTLRNVSIVFNAADADSNGTGDGGGIANSSGNATITNSILASNTDFGSQGTDCYAAAPGSLAVRYLMLPSAQTCTARFSPAPVSLLAQSPNPLSPLQPNGGPTPTHDLLAGSPASDAGDPAGCGVATDQRGVPRPQGARCDLGAVEAGAPDTDADRVPDPIDDCPTVANLDQRDSDGDGVGDRCDNCPSVGNPTQSTSSCITATSKSATIDSSGGTLTAGGVTITVPAGALGGQPSCVSATCPTSFSSTGLTNSEYGLGSAASGSGLYLAAKLQPENVTFNSPVTLTFSWPDMDAMPGVIDGTSITELFLRIFQNGVAITNTCATQPCGMIPCCNTTANTFTVQVTSFSELALVQDGACVPTALRGARLELTHLKPPPTDDTFRLAGRMALPVGATPSSIATQSGMGVVLADAGHGILAGARFASGKYTTASKRGWRQSKPTVWRYLDSTASPPGGIRRVRLESAGTDADGHALIALVVRGRGGAYVADETAEATVTLDIPKGPCFRAQFPGAPGPKCVRNPSGSAVRCR